MADKGYKAEDADMVEDEGDSSGFEDVDSDEDDDDETIEEAVKPKKSEKSGKKAAK